MRSPDQGSTSRSTLFVNSARASETDHSALAKWPDVLQTERSWAVGHVGRNTEITLRFRSRGDKAKRRWHDQPLGDMTTDVRRGVAGPVLIEALLRLQGMVQFLQSFLPEDC